MRFRVLGPLRVWDGAGWSPVRAAQQRVVLAVLLAEAGRPVTKDRLVDEIWGDRPPPSAVGIVQDYVRQLRRLVGGGTRGPLVTRGPGYELGLADDELDAAAFDRLAAAGRRELAAGRLADGARQLADGLALWQGPALADVPASPTVATHAARLDRSRLAAAEERLGAQLDLGRHSEVLGELDRLIGEHPLQERLRAQLMLALYRCGRRSEALTAYRGAREVLVAELGLEPGRELRELQRAILADDPRLTAPTPFADLARPAQPAQPARPAQPDRQPGPAEAGAGRGTPAQLPAAVAAFTGRDRHLRELDGLLATGAAARPPVLVISTIAGAAGVGKTALAVHWARRVAGAFPDGQLHVNLRGHAAGPPVRPLEALAGFLHALGVPPADVPSEVEQAAALYRSVLAGKRVLVVLDNARHPDQVRPLLPSEPGCLVIVTSRDQLGGLVARDGAVRLALDVLTPAEARLLLARLLGADRVAAEPLAAAELAELCGRLPLALRIAAANLGAAPRTTIARYTSQLAAGDRLAALEVDGDPQASVRAAFELSYRDLPGAAQRLFRLLGLVPGPDLTPPAAAALAAVPVEQAARLLDRLAAAHLVEHRVPGRYGCHDLLRRYAAERAGSDDPAADRQAALGRLVDFYLHSVAAAAERLYPHLLRPPLDRPAVAAPASFDDHTQALNWLDAERVNLVAAVRQAADHGPAPAGWRLALLLRGYFILSMHTVDWATVARAALTAAHAAADPRAQAAAHLSLAALHWMEGRQEAAIEHFTPALRLSRQAGWPAGEATALGNLGSVHWVLGRPATAADYHTQALERARQAGQVGAQALVLGNLGLVHWVLGRLESAADQHGRSLALYRQIGCRSGEADALANVGGCARALGRLDEAIGTLTESVALHREVGDRPSEAEGLRLLADALLDAGRSTEALEHAQAAVALARDVGNPYVQAGALASRGRAHHQLGRYQDAADDCRQAVELARGTRDRYVEAGALVDLAAADGECGRRPDAVGHAEAALTIAQQTGYRLLEGDTLTTLADLRLGDGAVDLAVQHAEQAIAVQLETGYRLGLARAHGAAQRCLDRAGRHAAAETHRRAARTLFDQIGAPRPGSVEPSTASVT